MRRTSTRRVTERHYTTKYIHYVKNILHSRADSDSVTGALPMTVLGRSVEIEPCSFASQQHVRSHRYTACA